MTMVIPEQIVDDYVAAVRRALGPVQAAEHHELLDELADHLREEDGAPSEVAERLGSPEDYARDFLSSAGIEPTPPASTSRTASLRAPVDRAWRWVRRTWDANPELRPAWLVVRAWGLLVVLTLLPGGSDDLWPIPHVVQSHVLSAVVLVALVVLSLRVGRTGGRGNQVLTVLAACGLLFAAASSSGDGSGDVVYYEPTYGDGLVADDGHVIENIWPYDAQGRPLDDVLLFDQTGEPVEVSTPAAAGQARGAYPRQQTTYQYDDQTGVEREVPMPPPYERIPGLGGVEGDASTSTTVAPGEGEEATSTTTPTTLPEGATTTAPTTVTPPP